jgi:hypothetical protein
MFKILCHSLALPILRVLPLLKFSLLWMIEISIYKYYYVLIVFIGTSYEHLTKYAEYKPTGQ